MVVIWQLKWGTTPRPEAARLPHEQVLYEMLNWPSSGPSKIEKGLHYVVIYIKRPQCREIPAACIALSDQVFSGTPGEFRVAVLYGDDVGNHSGMAAVSICERMYSRQLMMKTKERLVSRERLVL